MSNEKKILVRNIASLGVVQFANYILPLVSIPVISRIIGPEKFGVINFAASVIAYFTLLINYGFNLSATRKIARDPQNIENRNKVFTDVFFTQCILLIISAVIFAVLLFNLPELEVEKKVAVFSFLICFSSLLTQNWLFQAMQDISKIVWVNLFSKIVFTIFVLLLVRQREDYIWQPLILSITQILAGVFSFLWAKKRYRLSFTKTSLRTCFELLWDEKIIFFSLVVISLYTTTNTVILGLFQTSEQVGYYTAGQKLIANIQTFITVPVTQALYPFIGKAFAEDRNKGIETVQRITPIIVIVTFFAGLVLLLFAPFIIPLFYGDAFRASIPVFEILTFIPFIIALSNIFGIQIMLNLNMDKIFFRITALGAILSIISNLVFVKQYGYMASAYVWLITEIFITISCFIALRIHGIHIIRFKFFRLSSLLAYIKTFK